jgi:acetate kinase
LPIPARPSTAQPSPASATASSTAARFRRAGHASTTRPSTASPRWSRWRRCTSRITSPPCAPRAAFPDAVQIACFDTAFHRAHPWVNDTFALPREWYDKGVRRYGFHGLSYEYVSGEIARIAPELRDGRVVIAHLGNGASMCAVRDGKSVASTMGFTALDGLPMGTRCGQLDPGVVLYMMDHEKMTPAEITDLLYRKSGLKGLRASATTCANWRPPTSRRPPRRSTISSSASAANWARSPRCWADSTRSSSPAASARHSAHIRARGLRGHGLARHRHRPGEERRKRARSRHRRTRVMVVPTDEERVIARAVNAALPG